MTSSTRLPTVWPTRPLSQPSITWPTPIAVPNGWRRDQVESKTFFVRQITPAYWTTMNSPLATFGPRPLVRVLIRSVLGAAAFGMVIFGPFPAVPAFTVGSAPPPFESHLPPGPAVLPTDFSRSTTKTTVSVGPTPIDGSPVGPNASAGGSTASIRLPSFRPINAFSRPGSSGPENNVGNPVE